MSQGVLPFKHEEEERERNRRTHGGRIEKGFIIEALSRSGGAQVKVAEILGINQRSLWHRIKNLGVNVETMKNQQIM